MIEGMATTGAPAKELDDLVQRLAPRWFVIRDVHANESLSLLQPRWALSWMRGPMTRSELQRALAAQQPETPPCTTATSASVSPAA